MPYKPRGSGQRAPGQRSSASNEPSQALCALGRTVKAVRLEQGQCAEELAKAARIPSTELIAIEAGRFDPPYDVLLALADALHTPIHVLVVRAEEPPEPNPARRSHEPARND
jgi:transcriptional regulator with XRE-family HTH domain